MANKWLKAMQKWNGVVTERKDVFADANLIKTFSPTFNSLFGRSHGVPGGYSVVLYGPPKGGKSVMSHLMIGWLHQTNPEALALKIDTEYRADGQLDETAMKLYGIDEDRLVVMQTNKPVDIFDQIETKVAALCQSGAPLKLIVIDSLNGIQGRQEMANETIDKRVIGDHALTVQTGMKRIMDTIRNNNICLVLIDQVRAEMRKEEVQRGNKFKMQSSFGVQHVVEYFVCVEENLWSTGHKDLTGKDFRDRDAGETSAMKICFKMKDSTMAGYTKGRTGELTFDFRKGLINVNEEVFLLGTRRGVITSPKNGYYDVCGTTYHGKPKTLSVLEDQGLQDLVIAEVIRRDMAGEYDAADRVAAEADENQETEE